MSLLIPKKVGQLTYKIEPDSSQGMRVPVTIYANESIVGSEGWFCQQELHANVGNRRILNHQVPALRAPGTRAHAYECLPVLL